MIELHSKTGTRPSRRERSKADKMRRILAAGEKLFSHQGFDGTTVQQIADEADVAVGTLFLYISDKSELLLRLFLIAMDLELQQAVKRLKKDKRFMPAVKRFLTDLMVPYERDRELAKVFWREFLFHKGKVRSELDQQTKEVLRALEEKIVTAQTKGEIDDNVDAPVGALHLYGIYHATLAFSLADCLPGTSPGLTLDSLLQSAWRGIAPRTEAVRDGKIGD
jgi:AcrR family transcriptional regulator